MALRRPVPLPPSLTGLMARSYSYQGQDLFVVEATGCQRNGFFLDSGASGGLRGSNTKLLEESFGWRGICVEPNLALYGELVANRSCICLNCCLYSRDGPVEFFEAGQVYGGIVAEYHLDHFRFARDFAASESAKLGVIARPETVMKEARTLRSVLRSCDAPPVIDYWSLDTEGSELALLRSFPYDEYRFRLLTVEHNFTPARGEIHAFLTARGYRRVRSFGIDDGYMWVGSRSSWAWRSRAWASA
jgi:Methyltransferase FkbM domain